MTVVASLCPPSPAAVPYSLVLLCKRYRRHGLAVRSVTEDTVDEELLYLKRFFTYLGAPESVEELFALIDADRVHRYLLEYAETHGPGSRRWMQISLRSFLRFAYHCCYLPRDLSALVPASRTRRLSRLPRALPDHYIAALSAAIDRGTAAGLRDSATVCLLSTYGVRGVQVRRLRLDHLDWEKGRIVFPAVKGGLRVEQHLTAEAGNRLADYIQRGRPDSTHAEVFLTLSEPFRALPCASYLSAMLRRRLERLPVGVPAGTPCGSHGLSLIHI